VTVQLPVTLVTATRESESGFWRHTWLGRSLRGMPAELRPDLRIRFENHGLRQRGLPELYNRAIDQAEANAVLLFVHDDVYLHDAFVRHRLAEALERVDVVGLAGSRGLPSDALSWALGFTDELASTGWHEGVRVRFAGAVSHVLTAIGLCGPGAPPLSERFVYGPLQAQVDLLDGLFLAATAGVLRDNHVRFDERFRFHLYDTDFCRTARQAELVLGTYPILVSHASGGNYDSPDWKAAARLYRQKWAAVSPPAPMPSPPLTESHP
jgi:GT2 family glycosyltransferase